MFLLTMHGIANKPSKIFYKIKNDFKKYTKEKGYTSLKAEWIGIIFTLVRIMAGDRVTILSPKIKIKLKILN